MHEAHHDDQRALVVTPIWLSLAMFAGLAFLPLGLVAGAAVSAGLTGGLMLGYFCFEGVHHIIHHCRLDPGTFGYRLKRRHMLHHHVDAQGNFGVTNGFWDIVFGTDVKVRGSASSSDLTR
jgi:sterol desaturase/sphingolipid hydroxylase (fatty acid hydroxylase superfamily)